MKKILMLVLSLTVFALTACQEPATTDPAATDATTDAVTEAVTEDDATE